MNTTLISFASRQIWPHVLPVTHIRPDSLLFLHSPDANESRLPAQRMAKFFKLADMLRGDQISLKQVPYDDFQGIVDALNTAITECSIRPENCVLNFTGGNKLMAAAGFHWAMTNSIRSCYLERGNKLVWLDFADGKVNSRHELLSGNMCNDLDPLRLLRCQLDASEVERDGELLRLSKQGQELSEQKFFASVISSHDVWPLLHAEDRIAEPDKKGDRLELSAAAILLKLGVPEIRRSVRLKVRTGPSISSKKPHAELDLLFNWSGRLWLVDCKDRKAPSELAKGLQRELKDAILSPRVNDLINRIKSELAIGQTKVMKEDLLAMREMGGLLGRIVCLRRAPVGDEVAEFARSHQIEVVLKKDMVERFRRLLHPNEENPQQS